MKPRTLAIAATALALGVASSALLWRSVDRVPRDAVRESPSPIAQAPVAPPVEPLAAPMAPARPPDPGDPVAQAEAAVVLARSEHSAALRMLEDAKAALDDVEPEIAAVERTIDDLEARGEDPTHHAFEVMERLNPVIDRFDERQRAVEAAEAKVRETERALDAAEDALGALRTPAS